MDAADIIQWLGVVALAAVVAYQFGWNRGYDEAEESWHDIWKRDTRREYTNDD